MSLQDVLGRFASEFAKRTLDQMAAQSGPARVCSHCRNRNLADFAIVLPCCSRTLCGPCASAMLIHKWESRCVFRCDDCESVHVFTFER